MYVRATARQYVFIICLHLMPNFFRNFAAVRLRFAGAGIQPATVSRPITPYDVAPTLANYLGVKPPSGAVGNPLVEVVGSAR